MSVKESHCIVCAKENPPTKSNRGRKYCSKKCANKFHQIQNSKRNPNYGDPNWKNKTKLANEAKEERRQELEWYRENWLTAEQIGEMFGLHLGSIHVRAQKLGIEPKVVHHCGRKYFYNPEDIQRFKEANKNPDIPEGYLTSDEAIEYLGYTKGSFWTLGSVRGRKRPEPSMVQTGVPTCGNRNLYSIEDLDKWIEEGKERFRARGAEREKKRQEKKKQKRKEEAEFKKKTKGLIRAEEAAKLVGYKAPGIIYDHKEELKAKRIRGRWWFNPDNVKQWHKAYLVCREDARIKRRTSKRHLDGYGASGIPLSNAVISGSKVFKDEVYEERLWARWDKYDLPDYTNRCQFSQKGLEANKRYREQATKGNIVQLDCRKCKRELPYTKFYADFKTKYGRMRRCKECHRSQRSASHQKNKEERRQRYRQNVPQRLRTIVACTIKSSLSKRNDAYQSLSIREIWDDIEKYCGYNHNNLAKHLESQFSSKMNWGNHGQATKSGEFRWNVDHIKPRSSFEYKSTTNPEFAKCWSLQNLRPIEARLNAMKSNKSLRGAMRASFVNGLIRDKRTESGIWPLVPYTVEEAKVHLEKQFDKDMNWDNYGTVWHIDHIVPQAYLSYVSPKQKNFKICWALSNLQPLKIRDNCAKSSLYKDILWVYNDI